MSRPTPESSESARQRALRIRLDYVHRPDLLTRGKRGLTLVALCAAVAYCGWIWLLSPTGRRHFAPDRVAAAHRHFEHDCQACHVDFVPLRGDASSWPAQLLGKVTSRDVAAPHRHAAHGAIERQCQSCHFAAPHHRQQRVADIATCADCHREHQGGDVTLRHVANQQCTTCHRDLSAHREGPSKLEPEPANIDAFAHPGPGKIGHPEFRSLRDDPGTIKFHHGVHLTAGLPARNASEKAGRPLKTLADLPADLVERYRQFRATDKPTPDHEQLVQLDCTSCHHALDPAAELGAGRSANTGVDYAPIRFERDCSACHPLPFDAQLPEARVPHGLTPGAIATYLTRFYAAQALEPVPADARDAQQPWRPQRPIPGRTGDQESRAQVERTVVQQVALAQQYLKRQGVCSKCHDERSRDATDSAVEEFAPRVAPAAIPQRWFRHATFSHASHQMLVCAECHAKTLPSQGENKAETTGDAAKPLGPATDRDEVMIASRETCLRCHASSSPDSTKSGPASSDCVLCHRYHGADYDVRAAAAPRGSPLAPPAGPRRTISDWLAPRPRPTPP